MTAARWLNAAQFKEHVAKLPPPEDYEEDPNWIRPVGEAGLGHAHHGDNSWLYNASRHASTFVDTEEGSVLHRIPTHAIDSGQETLQLEALHHYVDKGPTTSDLYDRDGWYGTSHPVLTPHPTQKNRMVIMDGTHRVAAARLRGESHVMAHVVPKKFQKIEPPRPSWQ